MSNYFKTAVTLRPGGDEAFVVDTDFVRGETANLDPDAEDDYDALKRDPSLHAVVKGPFDDAWKDTDPEMPF